MNVLCKNKTKRVTIRNRANLACVYTGICTLLKYLCMSFISKITNNYSCEVDLMRPVVNFGNMEKTKVQSSCFITRYFI